MPACTLASAFGPHLPACQAAVETEHAYRSILAFTAFLVMYLGVLWLQVRGSGSRPSWVGRCLEQAGCVGYQHAGMHHCQGSSSSHRCFPPHLVCLMPGHPGQASAYRTSEVVSTLRGLLLPGGSQRVQSRAYARGHGLGPGGHGPAMDSIHSNCR